MAEAIALHLLMERPPRGVKVRVFSAGTGAIDGDHASEENAEALKAVGVVDVDMRRHRSRALTAELIVRSTVVYVMASTHATQARSIAGDAAVKKVQMLDPAGKDIPDPVGRGSVVYRQTAQKLMEAIRQRLAEVISAEPVSKEMLKQGPEEGQKGGTR